MTNNLYNDLGFIYFPITFNPFYCNERQKIIKGVKLPTGWNLRTISEEGKYLAIRTGAVSNLTVVDFDELTSYEQCLAHWPELAECYTVKTRRGFHVYFTYQKGLSNSSDMFLLPGMDIRNDGGCIIAPPSSYEYDGETYTYEFKGGKMRAMPDELIKLLKPTDDAPKRQVIMVGTVAQVKQETEKTVDNLLYLVSLLSPKRASSYSSWSKVGFALYNILGYSGEGAFDIFSATYPKKYDEREVGKWYRNLRSVDGGYTERSLHYWAKEDNPELYAERFGMTVKKLMKHDLTQNDTATCYDSLMPQRYVFSGGCWYCYAENNIIQKLDKTHPDKLRTSISHTVQRAIQKELSSMNVADETYSKMLAMASKCHKTLGMSGFISGVIDYLRAVYTDDTFADKIDTNMDLLAFTNGVFDYSMKEFRPIEKEDYVMRTTKYALTEESNASKRTWLMSELMNIFNTQEMVTYWLETIAMALFRNHFEKMYCHTGSGGNGKGVLFTLIKEATGAYYYQAPNEFLTTTYKADAPNSTLANARGVRIFVTSEPSTMNTEGKGLKISTDLIKMLTGGDEINARDLYQTSKQTFKPVFTPFLQCNAIPELSKVDGGMRRRFVKQDYPNKFVQNPAKPNERPVDYTLKAQMQEYEVVNEFMLLLLDVAKAFTVFHVPLSVKESTNDFLDDSDKVLGWLQSRVEVVDVLPDREERITKSQAHTIFKEYLGGYMSPQLFHAQMKVNEVNQRKVGGNEYYFIKRRNQEEE